MDDGGRAPSLESLVKPLLAQLRVDGDPYLDLAGPAFYVVGPVPYTFTACRPCRYVGLVTSIPRKPVLYWKHDGCGAIYRLEPPAAVVAAGRVPPAAVGGPRPAILR